MTCSVLFRFLTAAALAVAGTEPTGDIHGSREYRRGLIETLVYRALLAAREPA